MADIRRTEVLLHGEGSASRACRRGHHQYCPGGCECSCHIPEYRACRCGPDGQEHLHALPVTGGEHRG